MTPEERCKKTIYTNRGFSSHQCTRKIWKDRFCKIHHPDNVKARQIKSESLADHKYEQRKQWLCKDAIRQAQQEAYEEAANICDKMKEKAYEDGEGSTDIPAWINNCSNIIRALKANP